jgi:hypothetical protein
VIKNVWGKQLDIVDLNPTGRRVPTGTNRIYSGEWLGSPWRFGVYTVELYVFPDETEAVTRASTSVVLFSWRTFSILGVSGLITGAFIYALLGARRR